MIALDDAAWASSWRRVPVAHKLGLSLGLMVTALAAPPWPAAPLVALAAVGAAVGVARIPARVLAIGFAAPFAFIAIGATSVAIQLGAAPPGALFALGPLSVSQASALNAAGLFAKSVAGTLAMLLLATTTPMVDLLGFLRRIRVPGSLVEVASLMYRLLFVLLDVAVATHTAQVARLGDAPAGAHRLRRRFKAVADSMGTLLVRSWSRAERLSDGLAARGIDGDLLVLAPRAQRAPRFLAGTAGTLGAIWALTAAWLVMR